MNQAGKPLAIKHLVDALNPFVFPPPSLKFRTAGFPQYGFKPELDGNLRLISTYMPAQPRPQDPMATHVACQRTPLAQALQSRGPWLPSGLCCPAGSLLTMASSEPRHPHLAAYFLRLQSVLGTGGSPLLAASLSSRAISRTPVDQSGACDCSFPDHASLRHLCTSSASTLACLTSVLAGRVTRLTSSLSLRPGWLLARHRHGLLHSSFRANGYPQSTSNITTRLQSIAAAGLSPARDAASRAAGRGRGEKAEDAEWETQMFGRQSKAA
jgi:hypothetical protein